MSKVTYKDAGVDLETYRQSMNRLPRLMHRTFSPRVLKKDGGFAGLFQLDFASRLFGRNYVDPVLVSCTDGVGTKLKVATMAGRHDTVGIDLVAMCVNDALCFGAEPLFFLDYVAMAQDDSDLLEQIVQGISDGCVQADSALLGGETAIMPDLYRTGDYDLAGFCVGVVDRKLLVDGSQIQAGDVVLGIASSGLHSNGYSLVRKIVFEVAGLELEDYVPELQSTVADVLLQPTKIYVRLLRQVMQASAHRVAVHGIAHITGGGLLENVARILPQDLAIRAAADSWDIPPVFSWLQNLGDVDQDEMNRVFNMGIGMALIVSCEQAEAIQAAVVEAGSDCWKIGDVTIGNGEARWT